MFDIWGFLTQTLCVSTVAAVVLIVKALFKDKLPPKWHFAVWSVLALSIIIPSGTIGEYSILNWQFPINLLKIYANDFSNTTVKFPFPVITESPKTPFQWLFLVYALGVAIHLALYAFSYLRLKIALRKSKTPSESTKVQIMKIAEELKVSRFKIAIEENIDSAFVFGFIRPILVLPTEEKIDSKIIMHELMHIKWRDTFWSIAICILKSLHWCNPLIVYCAKEALNDMENRCDQFVLEQLNGNEIRQYGNVLLSMVNERFAKTPGATSINNGGKNIRRRIETIARFKKYPSNMTFVSICIIIVLAVTLLSGTSVCAFHEFNYSPEIAYLATAASAKTTNCTTFAGAIDAYAKAVQEQNTYYRLMCATESEQTKLIKEIQKFASENSSYAWDSGLDEISDCLDSYTVHNLKMTEENKYTCLVSFLISDSLNAYEYEADEDGNIYYHYAYQPIKIEKDGKRWVVIPNGDFVKFKTIHEDLSLNYSILPGETYVGSSDKIEFTAKVYNVYIPYVQENVDNIFSFSNPNRTPTTDLEFANAYSYCDYSLKFLTSQKELDKMKNISYVFTWDKDKEHDFLPSGMSEFATEYSFSNSDGYMGGRHQLSNEKVLKTIHLDGGGSSIEPNDVSPFAQKAYVRYSIDENEYPKIELQRQEAVQK